MSKEASRKIALMRDASLRWEVDLRCRNNRHYLRESLGLQTQVSQDSHDRLTSGNGVVESLSRMTVALINDH